MVRKLALPIIVLALSTTLAMAGGDNYNEYNHRLARISYIENNVAFAHGDEEWTAASINTPLQPGDRIYAPARSRAEIQFDDGSALRIGSDTEVMLTRLDDDHVQIRQSVGLTTLRTYSSLYFEVNTPAAAITADEKGSYRIEVQENGGMDLKVRKGRATVYNRALERRIHKGQQITIYNQDGADFEVASLGPKDDWDYWNDRRDAAQISRVSTRYLPDSVYMGAYDLNSYGRWVPISGYGDCWIPTVAVGWSPYRIGRWIYRPFWGWTWISYEPWGWLPYHYGRWFYSGPVYGWAWHPGPRYSFFFWSPGLVRFSYGPDWVSWCPLGPRDYVSINLFFGRSYYRGYVSRLDLGSLAYTQLYNHRAPNAIVSVTHNTFISGPTYNTYNTYINKRVVNSSVKNTYITKGPPLNASPIPANPFSGGGTVIKDHQLPIKPTVASFSPNPTVPVRAPKPEIVNRPVFVNASKSIGPAIKAHDPATSGLSIVPPSAKGSPAPGTTNGGSVTPAAPPGKSPGVTPVNRDTRISSPIPGSPKAMETHPAGVPKSPAVGVPGKSFDAKPGSPSGQPSVAPAQQNMPHKPGRVESTNWPTAPVKTIDKSNTPARSLEKPGGLSAPAKEARPPKPVISNSPSQGTERPGLQPAAPNRDGKPVIVNPPASNRDFIQAPPRNHSSAGAPTDSMKSGRPSVEGSGQWRRAEPSSVTPPSRPAPDSWNRPSIGPKSPSYEPSAPRYSPPPVKAPRSIDPGAGSSNYQSYPPAKRNDSIHITPSYDRGWRRSEPSHNPPPVHNSPPPIRSAPSYDSRSFGKASAPSAPRYTPPPVHNSPPPAHNSAPPSGGRAISVAPAGGMHVEGGKSSERHNGNKH